MNEFESLLDLIDSTETGFTIVGASHTAKGKDSTGENLQIEAAIMKIIILNSATVLTDRTTVIKKFIRNRLSFFITDSTGEHNLAIITREGDKHYTALTYNKQGDVQFLTDHSIGDIADRMHYPDSHNFKDISVDDSFETSKIHIDKLIGVSSSNSDANYQLVESIYQNYLTNSIKGVRQQKEWLSLFIDYVSSLGLEHTNASLKSCRYYKYDLAYTDAEDINKSLFIYGMLQEDYEFVYEYILRLADYILGA